MNMLDKARQIQDQMVVWRRTIHMNPELGFQEDNTSAMVAEICERLGLRVSRKVGRTGVVAELGKGKPVFAIRADMDALPIQEANDVPYRSKNSGIMHACGHDAHTAMGLGAALLLAGERFEGTVRFIFQPSEETADSEGYSGAQRMIQSGVIKDVDMIIALHVDPGTKVGVIRNGAGPASGGVDSWFGSVVGKGGHGAHPIDAIDPIYLSAYVIMALNGLISRRIHPFDPAVVSIGSIHAGQAENVIPDRVEITGTLRYTETRVQKLIHSEIQRAFEMVHPMGGEYHLRFEIGTPPMQNDPNAVRMINAVAAELLGTINVLPMENELGAEDFGCFSDLVPGAMFMLGAMIADDRRHGHNPRFDIDEGSLPVGASILAGTALRFMAENV